MRKQRIFAGALLTIACTFAGGNLLFPSPSLGQVPGVLLLPPPTMPPDFVALTPEQKLGKFMLYDTTLSNPKGYACATCHIPETGFTGPSSLVNELWGPQPGVVLGRIGDRKPQSYVYAAFCPIGPYFDTNAGVYIGGDFWDGRVPDLATQALQPPINPNEMANTATNGVYPPLAGGYSALVAQKLATRPYTPLFLQVYGQQAFQVYTPEQIYKLFGQAVAAYESTGEVNPFSSKYDASPYGTPPQNLYTLTASEERGRILYGVGPNPTSDPTFGQAQCFACHSSAALPAVQAKTYGKDTFTMFCYANIGVPKNPLNPYYLNINPITNPHGYNPLGFRFIDWGLGGNPNPAPDGTRFYTTTPGDILQFRGLFKTPSTRQSDKRPSPDFVKAYMHNGVFKSLEEVVRFYNKRNIAVNAQGNEVAFDLRVGPPPGYTRLFPPPEVLDNVQNVIGYTPAQAIAAGTTGVTASNGQVGHLGLTPQQETDVVNFLKILSDGYTAPNPVPVTP
jgi:cytochrome c peroxidase